MAPRTEAELRDDLRDRGVPGDVAERVLARFVDVGLIDDSSYARMWVQSRHRSKGEARSVIRQQLRRKGIDDALADEALAEVSADDEWARACELVRRRLPSCARLEPAARTRRLVGMLQRRGYPVSTAYAAVRAVVGAAPDDDAQDSGSGD